MFGQSHLRESVLEWCLPVAHDCLREFYGQHLERAATSALLTQLHFKLWSALVRGDEPAARADAAILAEKAGRLKSDFDVCGAANRYVAAEVLDLSLRRFRRMPDEAMRNNQALLAILLRLTQSAAPAAIPASAEPHKKAA